MTLTMRNDCSTPIAAYLTYSQAGEQLTIRQSQVLLYFCRFGVLTKGGTIKRIIKSQTMGWTFFFLGTTVCSFSAEDLAPEAGVPTEQVRCVLKYFSLGFGAIDRDYVMQSPTHELKTRLFIRNGYQYLYPAPGSLVWAVQTRFEETLNPNSANHQNPSVLVWERYLRTRADYLERESLRLFKHALRSADVYHSLSYEIVQDGVRKQTELDGLILFDATLFLVEMKSGSLTTQARRGSKDRLKRDLKRL